MSGFSPSIYIYILIPISIFTSIYFFDFIIRKKTPTLFNITIWDSNLLTLYSIIIGFIIHLHTLYLVPSIDSFYIKSNTAVLLYFICILQLYVYSIFFKKILHLLPILITIFITTMPILFSNDLIVYFICIEISTMLIGFIFLQKDRGFSFNKALLGFIISNLTTLVLFTITISSLYYYFGTSDLNFIKILFNGTYTDINIMYLLIFSILIKIGQLPIYLYKINIYNGLNTAQLGLYIIIYINLFLIPSVYYIKLVFGMLMYSTIPFIIIPLYLITLIFAFNTNSNRDFLVVSTTIFTLLLLML